MTDVRVAAEHHGVVGGVGNVDQASYPCPSHYTHSPWKNPSSIGVVGTPSNSILSPVPWAPAHTLRSAAAAGYTLSSSTRASSQPPPQLHPFQTGPPPKSPSLMSKTILPIECLAERDGAVDRTDGGRSVMVGNEVRMMNSRWVLHEMWARNVPYSGAHYSAWNTNNLSANPAAASVPVALKGGFGHRRSLVHLMTLLQVRCHT